MPRSWIAVEAPRPLDGAGAEDEGAGLGRAVEAQVVLLGPTNDVTLVVDSRIRPAGYESAYCGLLRVPLVAEGVREGDLLPVVRSATSVFRQKRSGAYSLGTVMDPVSFAPADLAAQRVLGAWRRASGATGRSRCGLGSQSKLLWQLRCSPKLLGALLPSL